MSKWASSILVRPRARHQRNCTAARDYPGHLLITPRPLHSNMRTALFRAPLRERSALCDVPGIALSQRAWRATVGLSAECVAPHLANRGALLQIRPEWSPSLLGTIRLIPPFDRRVQFFYIIPLYVMHTLRWGCTFLGLASAPQQISRSSPRSVYPLEGAGALMTCFRDMSWLGSWMFPGERTEDLHAGLAQFFYIGL